MAGEIGEHRAALLHAGVAIGFAEHGLRRRLVQARMEQELAAVVRVVAGRADRPAGDHLGEAGDIVLACRPCARRAYAARGFRAPRFSLRPRSRLMPATELGPIDCALSR